MESWRIDKFLENINGSRNGETGEWKVGMGTNEMRASKNLWHLRQKTLFMKINQYCCRKASALVSSWSTYDDSALSGKEIGVVGGQPFVWLVLKLALHLKILRQWLEDVEYQYPTLSVPWMVETWDCLWFGFGKAVLKECCCRVVRRSEY